tara:strand:+ start:19473 stop:19994 length:522 start_codon:yes stop_codon:yes gene_type:complete
MNSLTQLKNKAANAITFIDALKSEMTLVDYAIKFLKYSKEEAVEVVKVWQKDHNEMVKVKGHPYSVLVELVQDTSDITPAKKITKNRTKIQGIKASFQSDKDGCSYVKVRLSKETEQTKAVLNKIVKIMISEDWCYYCAEYINDEGATFFGDNEKTIKQMKDDYQAALKLALN